MALFGAWRDLGTHVQAGGASLSISPLCVVLDGIEGGEGRGEP